MFKKKLKNYYFWSALAPFLLLLAKTFGLKVVEDEYNQIVEGFLGLLLMLGFLSKKEPKDKDEDPS